MPWVDAASATLPDETLLAVRQGASLVALARAAGSWYAVDGWCSHAECPLTDGWLEADAVRCACHASLFDLATGAPLEGPAEEPLRVYATRIAHGRVEVEFP